MAPLNARQRLDLAAEFLQVLARLRSLIEGCQLIISERTPEFDDEGLAVVLLKQIPNGDGLLVTGYAQTDFMRFLRERFKLPFQLATAVSPDRVEAREAGEFDFD